MVMWCQDCEVPCEFLSLLFVELYGSSTQERGVDEVSENNDNLCGNYNSHEQEIWRRKMKVFWKYGSSVELVLSVRCQKTMTQKTCVATTLLGVTDSYH